jgi:hypothetical protein
MLHKFQQEYKKKHENWMRIELTISLLFFFPHWLWKIYGVLF